MPYAQSAWTFLIMLSSCFVPHMIKAVVLICVQLAIGFLTVLNSTGRPTLRLLLTEPESWRGSAGNMGFSEESGWPGGKSETSKLLCPLCRAGQRLDRGRTCSSVP
ncbi:UNVERIFIED_CONTAM: hypothetical protein Sradi_3475200 [Sesamum radiatum]|uniref:Uncharacterized protein n=1 Tax=Sesamum radiatum TaxID=300843 RepID=A0AAW2QE58_SESRA